MSDLDPLAASPHFEAVSPDVLDALRRAGRLVRLQHGEIVLRPGERNHALHFVLAGTLEVRLEQESGVVSRVGRGECLGEMSVVDGQPVSAWVVADGPCETLCVPEEALWRDLLFRPGFARGLMRLLTSRLRQVLERQVAFEAVRKELRLAPEIQASMLPPGGVLFPDRGAAPSATWMVAGAPRWSAAASAGAGWRCPAASWSARFPASASRVPVPTARSRRRHRPVQRRRH